MFASRAVGELGFTGSNRELIAFQNFAVEREMGGKGQGCQPVQVPGRNTQGHGSNYRQVTCDVSAKSTNLCFALRSHWAADF